MIYRVGVEMNRWPNSCRGNVIFMNLTFYKTKIVLDVRV